MVGDGMGREAPKNLTAGGALPQAGESPPHTRWEWERCTGGESEAEATQSCCLTVGAQEGGNSYRS